MAWAKRPVWALLFFFTILSCSKKQKDPWPAPELLAFALPSLKGAQVSIDQPQGKVQVHVPHGSLLDGLAPQVELSGGAVMVPGAEVAQDFSRPVVYTVISPDGAKKAYTVIVSALPQQPPQLTGYSRDTVRAGEQVDVTGKGFDGPVSVTLLDGAGKAFEVAATPKDTARISITVPETLPPGAYQVKITQGTWQATHPGPLVVNIPYPVLSAFKQRNLLQGDTLALAGRFVLPQQYSYTVVLQGGTGEYVLTPFLAQEGKLALTLSGLSSQGLPPGSYQVKVHAGKSPSWSAASGWASEKLNVYSNQLPFVKGLVNPERTYRPGDQVNMQVQGLDKLPAARFYQLQLRGPAGGYELAGIYSAPSQQLTVGLPAGIQPARYALKILYLSASGARVYEQQIEHTINISQ